MDGRVAKPEIILLLVEAEVEKLAAEVDEELIALADDCAATIEDATLLLPPPPPPPQEIKHMQVVIRSRFFTRVFMVITS